MTTKNIKPLPIEAELVRTDQSPEDALLLAIQLAGGQHALSKRLGLASHAVAQWKRCPPARAQAVSRITGVPEARLLGADLPQ